MNVYSAFPDVSISSRYKLRPLHAETVPTWPTGKWRASIRKTITERLTSNDLIIVIDTEREKGREEREQLELPATMLAAAEVVAMVI